MIYQSNFLKMRHISSPDPGPVSSEISDLCKISDLLLFAC